MSESSVQRFYRFQAAIYDLTRWTILRSRRDAVGRLELQPDSSVLEVGCGTGLNFGLLRQRLDSHRGRITGLDFSPQMLARARKRVRRRGWSNVELVQADAATLSLTQRFDAILYSYSLSMIPDWRSALRRSTEHLQSGGRLVVLDFGRFERCGPLGRIMRGWLRWNHVQLDRPYLEELHSLFAALHVRHWLGGYNFIAIGRRSANG